MNINKRLNTDLSIMLNIVTFI